MQEDVLVMDVGCACDVLWMYVMDYVCVLCDAKCLCAVSCIIYEFCVFAFEGKQQTKKIANFPALPSANTGQRSLCRVPGVWHSAKLEKNAAKTATSPVLPSATAWHSAKRSILPSARWYHSAKTIFKKIFFKKKWFLCRVLSPGSRQKFKFCRVPVPRHSAKPASNVDGSYFFAECGLGTRQRLCRVSIFGTRQRNFCR